MFLGEQQPAGHSITITKMKLIGSTLKGSVSSASADSSRLVAQVKTQPYDIVGVETQAYRLI